ncbi:hypothetical protein [Pelagicoccus albus]|uniref:O-antigen ligase n=1 Tax=Pelagicoccus albus TaxID=415222 RepID=A0A7X1B9L8_9BACT|nr:hypothetical protein [Pelagicoccus albus]MBC2608245.1 hypothetical protein [Pelagicoccus albus]
MSSTHILLTVLLIILQFVIPRKWAFLPLLIAGLHTSSLQVIPSFSTARLIIFFGMARIILTGQLSWSRSNPIDKIMFFWGFVCILSSIGHDPTSGNPWVIRARMAFDVVGTYLYAKAYLKDFDDYKRLAKAACFASIPLALGMTYTKLTGGFNIYSLFGGSNFLLVRNGTARAIGPFGTPILAGTIGALLIPTIITIWNENKKTAILGIISCMGIVLSAGSSTPIGALIICSWALMLWRWRQYTGKITALCVSMLIFIQLVKDRPVWYLIAITDFVGGSTGWHRAYLIDMAVRYFDEWWLWGSDYTRHWMPYGLPSVPEHCDLTNYYINLGVFGGVPLMLALILVIVKSFKIIRMKIREFRPVDTRQEFLTWTVGSLLFTHTLTCLTISYFDQSYIIFYFLIAFIANLKDVPPEEELLPNQAVAA